MWRREFCLGSFLFAVLAVSAPAVAQTSTTLLGQDQARQNGLHRMWFAQVEVDTGRGRVRHLTQHVSSTKAVTIHEIYYDGGRFVVTERDLDRFGRVLGKEEAKRLADVKTSDLKNLNLNPKPVTQTVPQITLYAVTDTGVVHAIDAETGRTLWKAAVANPQRPTEAAGASDKYVAVVNGSTLYVYEAANGQLAWERRVVGAPGAGPAITGSLVFVPMINGAMEAYLLDNTKLPPSIYRSQGRALVQPVYTGTNVAWPTDKGHLYVASGEQNRINFRLEAKDAIVAQASVLSNGRIVVSSIDGFVYCLMETTGTVLWRFSSGEPILETPVVYGDSVYTVTEDHNLFALDTELGQERWSASNTSRVIGASKDRLYCLNNTHRLTILDRQSGSRLGSLSTEMLDLPYINKETDRIILANSRGLIQCLREIPQEYPLIHIGLSKKEETDKRKKPKKAAPVAGEKAGEEAANPFSTEAPAATEKKEAPAAEKAGEKAKSDDPFGG